MIKSLAYTLIMLFLVASGVKGQEKKVAFRHFTVDDGLGLKYHYCTAQDKEGFIWLGTGDGLYRFDGHKFQKYLSPQDRDYKSISSLLISVVYDSVYNRLWLASSTDLQYFDLNNYTFHKWLDASHSKLQEKTFFKRIYKIDQHHLWVSSGDALFKYHIPEKKFTEITQLLELPKNCNKSIIKIFGYDKDNVILLFTNYALIINKFTFKYKAVPAQKDEYFVHAQFDAKRNKLYLSASYFLVAYDVLKQSSKRFADYYFTKRNKKLLRIFSAFCDFEDKYLFLPGASHSFLFDKENDTIVPYLTEDSNNALEVAPINCFKDRESNIWLNTFDNYSMVVYRPDSELITTRHILNKEGIHIEPYQTIRYNKDLYLVSGSGFTGIMTLNPNTAKYQIIDNPNQKHPVVRTCILLKDGRLFNADRDNINEINLNKQTFAPARFNINGKNQAIANVNYLVPAENTKVVAIARDTLFLLDFSTHKGRKEAIIDIGFQQTDVFNENLVPAGIYQGQFYFVSNLGVYVFDEVNFKLKRLEYPRAYNTGNSITQISCMDVDQDGVFWFGSDVNGLFKFNPKDNTVFQYHAGNSKLKANHVDKIHCLKGTEIWVASGDLIYVFNRRTNEWLFEYSSKTGIPGIAYGNFYIKEDNRMVLNYYPYILILRMQSQKQKVPYAPLLITSINFGGKERLLHPTTENLSFTLKPEENDVEVSFSYLQLAYSFNNRYRYQLEGIDTTWIVTNNNIVSYRRLPSGNYTLLLQASDANGIWNSQIRRIIFKVSPVFYMTWWFQLFSLSFLVLLGFLFYRYRIDKIKLSESLKLNYEKQLSKIELRALRAQMNPHFIFNSLNSIQKFIFKKDEYAASQYLTKFSRLIRYILEHSNQDFVSIREEVEMLTYYLELESLRFDKQFDYLFEFEKEVDEGWLLPSMVVQPHIENAIWHGLMHQEIRGELKIRFNKVEVQRLMITIEDNGIGREAASVLRSKQLYKKKSFGSSLSEQKLKSLSLLNNLDYSIQIIDLKDEEGNPKGTKVNILLPVITPEKYGSLKAQ